ncbi:MAG TPA: hypothetical protein VHF22_14625, partial [Planctomycetota bacterium]|nr:hypothetical protein [Planctomycetota bacterium]
RYSEGVRVGAEPSYTVTSPNLAGLVARAQTDLYDRLSGAGYTRLVRDGTMTVLARPSPPAHTSFPAP